MHATLSKSVLKISRVDSGLVLVDSRDFGHLYDEQLWSTSVARKVNTCILSDKPIVPGDIVYRPITNHANRSKRMLATAVDRAVPAIAKSLAAA